MISVFSAFRANANPELTNLYDENSNADLACDLSGVLWTRQVVQPQSGATGFTYQAVPAVANAIVAAAPVAKFPILTQCGGYNDSAGNIYVLLFNKTTPLNAGDVPFISFFVPMNASFSWTPSRGGRLLSDASGKLLFAVSSTKDTYTALATNIFFYAEGLFT